jgi:hypothetical protein
MKYKQRDALVHDLREFIDFLEEKGHELPITIDVTLSGRVRHYDPKTYSERDPRERKRELKQTVRLLKPVKKEYSGSSLNVTRKFGKLSFTVYVSREIACKMVKTGNKIIHAGTWIPERTEEEVEWVCTDPLLKETA